MVNQRCLMAGDVAYLLAKVTLVVALVALAASCTPKLQSLREDLTPAQRVYAARGELNIALRQAVAYGAQPECSQTVVVGCHDPGVLKAVLEAGGQADDAISDAETIVAAPGSDDAALLYLNTARAALGRISDLLAQPEEAGA
jgi:hypothetical protein